MINLDQLLRRATKVEATVGDSYDGKGGRRVVMTFFCSPELAHQIAGIVLDPEFLDKDNPALQPNQEDPLA